MKLLNGSELALFIKERQAREVTQLRRVNNITPKLAIVMCVEDPVINTYVRLKKKYGADLRVEVDVHEVKQIQIPDLIEKLNKDKSIHGIIVQLPLENIEETDEIVNLVAPGKDVDALGARSKFEPATPMAILWLLAGYNIDVNTKKVLLIGRGKLVGTPLEKILKNSGVEVTIADRHTVALDKLTSTADIIITATGSPAILYPSMVKSGVVIVDAGVASENGKTVGDVAPEMYDREDITITPSKGGVGPLTVCALFENVIRSAQMKTAKH